MVYKTDYIADRLEKSEDKEEKDPLVIAPKPDLDKLKKENTASVDLRLGTWFCSLRRARMALVEENNNSDIQIIKHHYVPFGDIFYLHPGSFVLGITMEWLRMPQDLAAYVIGKSSWGRRGLIIATATGVHPSYIGCLTLELSNVGEMPIAIKPGMHICQLFFESAKGFRKDTKFGGKFIGNRKPSLVIIKADSIAEKLAKAYH